MTDYQEQYDTNFPSLDDGVEDDTVPLGLVLKLDRQRALIAELAAGLGIYVRAHDTGNAVPPYIVTRAHELLAKVEREPANPHGYSPPEGEYTGEESA